MENLRYLKLNYIFDDNEVLGKHNGLAQICDFHVPRNTICFPYIVLNKFFQFSWETQIALWRTWKLQMVEVWHVILVTIFNDSENSLIVPVGQELENEKW